MSVLVDGDAAVGHGSIINIIVGEIISRIVIILREVAAIQAYFDSREATL